MTMKKRRRAAAAFDPEVFLREAGVGKTLVDLKKISFFSRRAIPPTLSSTSRPEASS
jgi:hypothetical protein